MDTYGVCSYNELSGVHIFDVFLVLKLSLIPPFYPSASYLDRLIRKPGGSCFVTCCLLGSFSYALGWLPTCSMVDPTKPEFYIQRTLSWKFW